MEKLRAKMLPPDQVSEDMIHFDATVAMAKAMLAKMELQDLEDVTFKDTLEMSGFLDSGLYTEEEIRSFYSITDPKLTIDHFYNEVYRVPEMLKTMTDKE